jgi:hypothetical protein
LSDVRPSDAPNLVRQVLGESLGYLYPAALRVAARFGVADHLTDGPKTPQELAALSGVQAEHLKRVLRFLATRGIFHEEESGAFGLTPAAELLRKDSPVSLRSVVLLFTDETYWRPAGRLDDTVQKGGTVFEDIFGSPFFDHVAADEERGRVFDAGLADLSIMEQGAIAGSYSFPLAGTVVDIAGGRGGMLHAVLSRNPGLRGVLFDREAVLSRHRLGDPAIAGRWETATGDFFEAVPSGGDFYLLKRIVHDKSDAESLRILRSCRAAMSDHARLLIIDAVVPPGNGPHPSVLSDLLMMTVWDGKERSEEEFGKLLADTGLKLSRIVPTPTALSIIEAVPA